MKAVIIAYLVFVSVAFSSDWFGNIETQGYTASLPRRLGPHRNVIYPQGWEIHQQFGWRKVYDPAVIPEGHRVLSRSYTQDPSNADGAIETLVTKAEAEIEAERIAALAAQVGSLVMALGVILMKVGWSIPCDSEAVTMDLLQRTLDETLTTEQITAKQDIAVLYNILQQRGVNDDDIAAVRATYE